MKTTPVRVVQMTSVHPLGDTRIFVKQARSLAAAGFAVSVVGLASGEPRGIDGVDVVPLPPVGGGRLGRMTLGVLRVLGRVLAMRPALAHFHDPELIPAGLVLRLFGIKAVYDVHEDYPKAILDKPWVPKRLRRLVATAAGALEVLASRRLDAVVAATPLIARRFPGPCTTLVRNFPRPDELAVSDAIPYALRPFEVGYVGVLSEERSLFTMIEAMARLPEPGRPRLLLGGRLALPEDDARMRAVPGWDAVDFLGWLERPAVARLLGRIRAGLVLLWPTPSYVEALPVKMFEYMAAGVPVIASDLPFYRRLLEDGALGLFADPRDPEAIAHAIAWVLANPIQAEAMAERAQLAVRERYNWDGEARALVDLYARLVAT